MRNPNIESERDYRRKWRALNKEKARQYSHHAYWKDVEKSRLYHKLWRQKNNHKYLAAAKKMRIKNRYGLSVEEYDHIIHEATVCSLCGETFSKRKREAKALDHDHVRKINRGVLHTRCNLGIGHFKDDPVLLRKAVLYLEKFL